ncbi:MAG: VWA domain-containing protein [Anaerolineaceae bacterium]|nr:VWA domain-containing protein [Anaerolineaceae bacterium]
MEMLWPGLIYLLGLIPVLVAVYIWILHRRRRFAVRYSSLALVRDALPRKASWRRHIPFGLFMVALASLAFALTRPVAVANVPTNQTTIMLAIDVSGSMRSRDISPSRIEAAESAALWFIQHQKPGTQIGIVAFSGYGELVQPPTADQNALETAVDSLTLGRRTAIGSGILTALDAISQVDKRVAASISDPSSGAIEPTPPPHGIYAPDIIVLLTDGVSNTGPLPLDAAQQAVDRGVRVYTIGFGTTTGGFPTDNNQQSPQGNNPFGGNQGGGQFGGGSGGGFYGGGFGFGRMGIDETTLKQIASMTGGNYHLASSGSELQTVFQNLPTYLITKLEITEISFIFAGIGALFALLAIGLAVLWHPLV